MDYLKKASRLIVRNMKPDDDQIISWVTPSGFIATQTYYETKVHTITTYLAGKREIRVLSELDKADSNKHASGMAPNFVHSLDAAHLHLTTCAAADAGIDFMAMIHDDYGTLAADSQKLFDLIRQSFVAMYTDNDPLDQFRIKYNLAPLPTKGTLDINEVLKSEYFFS
jgi:DNA-directed RNA polymerase